MYNRHPIYSNLTVARFRLSPKSIPACLVVFLWLFQPASASDPETINAILAEGDFQSALVEVEKALESDPENDRLKLQKGFTLIKLQKLDEAEDFYKSLIRQQPDNPVPMNNLGVVYQLQKKYALAVDQIQATISKFPDFIRAYENLGDTYIQMATQSYTKGRNRSGADALLVSKADLGQRFYALANANREPAMERYAAEQGNSSTEDSERANTGTIPTRFDNGSPGDTEQEVADFLRSWVVAWSGQKPDDYFSHYAEDFTPPGGLGIATWKDRKQRVINEARFINIRIEEIKIVEQGSDRILLTFNQHYESDTYQDETIKKMQLGRYGGNWKIVTEE